MARDNKRGRACGKRRWVETRPWDHALADLEAWTYDEAMRLLTERASWPEVPRGMHFAEYCDAVTDHEDWWLNKPWDNLFHLASTHP